MNAKLRRHLRRKEAAIQRQQDKDLLNKVELAMTGCEHKVNTRLSLPTMRERNPIEVSHYLKPQDKPITVRAKEKLVRYSRPLI